MIILGIESSCDETSVAIIRDHTVLSHKTFSQIDIHAAFGGVVPEIAARAHAEKIDPLVAEVVSDAKIKLSDLDALAAVAGPGLIGGVAVGLTYGKGLACGLNKPFIAVDHLEAHALMARFENEIPFPHLVFLASGGHTQFILMKGIGDYKIIGTTLDDALGEAFDKTAKLLGMPYPGGPQVEKASEKGRPIVPLPRPLLGNPKPNFSFSGLKSAVRKIVLETPNAYSPEDICASFIQTVCAVVEDRTDCALKTLQNTPLHGLVFAGGVARSKPLRETLKKVANAHNIPFFVPDPALCMDNGLMVAWAGYERFCLGKTDLLTVDPYPRKNLEEVH